MTKDEQNRTYLHPVNQTGVPQDVESLILVLTHVLLGPVGLARSGKATHHEYLMMEIVGINNYIGRDNCIVIWLVNPQMRLKQIICARRHWPDPPPEYNNLINKYWWAGRRWPKDPSRLLHQFDEANYKKNVKLPFSGRFIDMLEPTPFLQSMCWIIEWI